MSDFRSGFLLEVDVAESRLLLFEKVLPRIEDPLVNGPDLASDKGGLPTLSGPAEDSLDMPGRPRLPDMTFSLESISSLLFLYAADPMPRSAVCLNHEGSRAPNEAAIWSLLGSCSSVCSCDGWRPVTIMEDGRLPPSLEPGRGRCCHDSVPARARLDALGVDSEVEFLFDVPEAVDAVLDRLIEPKPLKSGISPPSGAGTFSGSAVGFWSLASNEEDGGFMVTGGDVSRLALVVLRESGREEGVCCLSGEMERARSGDWSALARALVESGRLCVADRGGRGQHSNHAQALDKHKQARAHCCYNTIAQLTQSPCRPLFASLLHFLLQFAHSLLVFAIALLRQFPHALEKGSGVEIALSHGISLLPWSRGAIGWRGGVVHNNNGNMDETIGRRQGWRTCEVSNRPGPFRAVEA